MVLGEKKNIPRHIMQAMVRTGTVHILVVSGFNVGVVAFAAMLVLKIFRLPRSPRFIIVILLLVVYCLATGASTPVVRATVMAAIMLTACLCHRQPDVWNALCLAAMSILLASPSQLFDIGFQLSFSSVIAILWLYPKIRTQLAVAQWRHRGLRFCVDNYLVSLSAWLGTCGCIAYSFKIFSPVTVVANIFIVPLASLITLCGVSLLAAAGVFPYICPAIGRTCELLIFALISINNFFLSLPCAYFHLA
jgi:competence protein ComEC